MTFAETDLALARQLEELGSAFCVNDSPYLVCDGRMRERNRSFLKGIDSGYFDFVARIALEDRDDSDSPRSSVLLRLALHHGLETLFSLLGAFLQAPDCMYGWAYRCTRTEELREVLQRIGRGDNTLPHKLIVSNVSWHGLAEAVYACSTSDQKELQRNVANFATTWQNMASFYLERHHIDEYNALKHGFRVRAGGFKLAVGVETTVGKAPPEEEMQVLVDSEWGAHFIILEPAYSGPSERAGKLTAVPTEVSVTWSVEQTARLLQLTGISIGNVVSAALIASGEKPSAVMFNRPVEDEIFSLARQSGHGVNAMRMKHSAEIPTSAITKDELRRVVEIQSALARARGGNAASTPLDGAAAIRDA